MSSVSVNNGQSVSQGQTLGYVGTTGSSTGNHLHFEIINASNVRVNPMNYVDPNNPSPSDDTQAPLLSINESGTVSSIKDISFSWTSVSGNITGYNLYVAKNIDGTVNYNWNNARIYLPGSDTLSYTFMKGGSLASGAYAAYVQAWNEYTNEKSLISNYVYFVVKDEIVYDVNTPCNGAVYDLFADKSFSVRGAINTGKKDVTCYAIIDNYPKQKLEAVSRTDVFNSHLYSAYCSTNMVGFSGTISINKLSMGNHSIKIIAESETVNKTLVDYMFCVTNSHNHSYSLVTTPPTCTVKGYTTYTCSCGDSYKDNYMDVIDHTASQWIVDNAADCAVEGLQHKECTVCHAVIETQSIAAFGHHDNNSDGNVTTAVQV